MKFSILEFRLLTLDDPFDVKYEAWSRIYEYKIVIKLIKKYYKNNINSINIHNTCWGYQGCHVTFYNELNNLTSNVIHSDLRKSTLPKTIVYDITSKPKNEYINNFDIVINISTVEEIKNFSHSKIINNLLEMTKPGGYCIITFDLNLTKPYPNSNTIDLKNIELYLNQKLDINTPNKINGSNSAVIENHCLKLNVGLIVIQKL